MPVVLRPPREKKVCTRRRSSGADRISLLPKKRRMYVQESFLCAHGRAHRVYVHGDCRRPGWRSPLPRACLLRPEGLRPCSRIRSRTGSRFRISRILGRCAFPRNVRRCGGPSVSRCRQPIGRKHLGAPGLWSRNASRNAPRFLSVRSSGTFVSMRSARIISMRSACRVSVRSSGSFVSMRSHSAAVPRISSGSSARERLPASGPPSVRRRLSARRWWNLERSPLHRSLCGTVG
jgi:hypothetical protein